MDVRGFRPSIMALTNEAARSAILYNRARNFDPELIRRIQRSVRVVDDGSMGPRTVAAIASWQLARGLEADGKVGPDTLSSFEKEWASAGEPLLAESATRSAAAYAEARGYDSALIEKIQITIGVPPSGRFDDPTIAAVARWQAGHGLAVDGRVGPQMLAALEREWAGGGRRLRRVYRIHPSVGIARLGDSPDAYFIGPEAPGMVAPKGAQRDALGFIKRQGARFRVYETTLDERGRTVAVRELNSNDAEIRWTVQLVNRKAAAPRFPPELGGRRNANIPDERRHELVIDSGRRSVAGVDQHVALYGCFLGTPVQLGALRTDNAGRLIVLGGHGRSSSPSNAGIEHYANNDGWHDDVGDGPVCAQIRFASGEPIEAEPAWVVVAPPRYSPEINNITTWYDLAYDVAARLDPRLAIGRVSFTQHVYPILERTVQLQWVSLEARIGHGRGTTNDFLAAETIIALASNNPTTRSHRRAIYEALRRPGTTGRGMPMLENGIDPNAPTTERSTMLTPTQLWVMESWAMGLFEPDWRGTTAPPEPLSSYPLAQQGAALDRAALESCIGGPFYPGIEASYLIAREDTYESPFRIKRTLEPGSLTEALALPWQADFQACQQRWWPAQRPTSVFREGSDGAHDWTAGIDMDAMVERWAELGFVRREAGRFIERERSG
jgi:peptidoglycan hydrolase-like protein with peptidoglycan-binding domain